MPQAIAGALITYFAVAAGSTAALCPAFPEELTRPKRWPIDPELITGDFYPFVAGLDVTTLDPAHASIETAIGDCLDPILPSGTLLLVDFHQRADLSRYRLDLAA